MGLTPLHLPLIFTTAILEEDSRCIPGCRWPNRGHHPVTPVSLTTPANLRLQQMQPLQMAHPDIWPCRSNRRIGCVHLSRRPRVHIARVAQEGLRPCTCICYCWDSLCCGGAFERVSLRSRASVCRRGKRQERYINS